MIFSRAAAYRPEAKVLPVEPVQVDPALVSSRLARPYDVTLPVLVPPVVLALVDQIQARPQGPVAEAQIEVKGQLEGFQSAGQISDLLAGVAVQVREVERGAKLRGEERVNCSDCIFKAHNFCKWYSHFIELTCNYFSPFTFSQCWSWKFLVVEFMNSTAFGRALAASPTLAANAIALAPIALYPLC